jgi:hypothetical protein
MRRLRVYQDLDREFQKAESLLLQERPDRGLRKKNALSRKIMWRLTQGRSRLRAVRAIFRANHSETWARRNARGKLAIRMCVGTEDP